MAKFGASSKARLSTCDTSLQRLFRLVVKHLDCIVIDGHRTAAVQNVLRKEGKSKVAYPHSMHNRFPSKAIDVAPYVNGKASYDYRHCCFFAGVVLAIAGMLKIKVRWGGNWDMDEEVMTDQDFQDLVHFELHLGD